ncbi:MAG: esterase [Gammaproteobacteria bacterium]|nr:esterase [Gammaproteobacteria bacterium]
MIRLLVQKITFAGCALSIAVLLLMGCAGKNAQSNEHAGSSANIPLLPHTIEHDGNQRQYLLRLPSGELPAKPIPLVLVLHGGGGRPDNFDYLMTNHTLSKADDSRSMMLVFPTGINKQWNDGRSEIFKGKPSYDDVGFIDAVISDVVSQYPIDESRIYATGISNGGHMSFRLGMELATTIAAIAPVTAQVSKSISKQIPAKTLGVMLVNGTEDPLVPYDGGLIKLSKIGRSRGEVLSSEQSAVLFSQHNGCNESAATITLPDSNRSDGTLVRVHSYDNCNDQVTVKLVEVVGGGHTWPGGRQYLGKRRIGRVSKDINASELILDFFLSQTR